MATTEKVKRAGKAAKAKKTKPKRPMSAYIFFFKANRAEILAESSSEGGSSNGKGTSFEDIGREIGQRWRNISAEDLVKYKKLAAADLVRYKKEKQDFDDKLALAQKEHFNSIKLALMCQGDSTESAMAGDDEEGLVMSREQLSNCSNQIPQAVDSIQNSQEPIPSASALGTMSNLTGGGEVILTGNNTFRSMSSSADDHIFWALLQHHHQQSSSHPSAPNEAVMKIILTQKALIEQQKQELVQKINTLQLRDALLDKLMREEVATLVPSGESNQSADAEGETNVARSFAYNPTNQLAQLLVVLKNPALASGLTTTAPISSVQALLGASGQPQPLFGGSFALAVPPASTNDPTSLVNMGNNQGGNALIAEELLKRLMGQSN